MSGIRDLLAKEQLDKLNKERDEAAKMTSGHAKENVVAREADKHFRFLDLPAELRNLIHTYAVIDQKQDAISLSLFVLPTITRTSEQLRAESLPLFFSENKFQITVYSNLDQRRNNRIFHSMGNAGPLTGQNVTYQKKAGTLGMMRDVKNVVKAAGANARLKNIEFKVVWTREKMAHRALDEHCTAHFYLGVERAGAKVTWTDGNKHPSKPNGNLRYYEKQDVDAVINAANAEALAIAGRHQPFLGFSLREVEAVAKKFRFIVNV